MVPSDPMYIAHEGNVLLISEREMPLHVSEKKRVISLGEQTTKRIYTLKVK